MELHGAAAQAEVTGVDSVVSLPGRLGCDQELTRGIYAHVNGGVHTAAVGLPRGQGYTIRQFSSPLQDATWFHMLVRSVGEAIAF